MNESFATFGALHQAVSEEDQSLPSAIADAVRLGLPAAAISGFASVYNTAASLGNIFGADIEKLDIGAKIADYDDDMSHYYQQHEKGVDLAGYIGTSLIPGIAGMKALKMAQNGLAGMNASSQLGLIKNTNYALNFFRNTEAKFTAQALDKIRSSTNLAYDSLAKEKWLAVAAGFGEQALQGAAFEGAVLLTMNQSPVLSQENEGYFTSLVRNSGQIVTGAEFSAAFGGLGEAFRITGKIRKAKETQDLFEAGSRYTMRTGEQEIVGRDPGSWIAAEFSFWFHKTKEFESRKALGNLTPVEIRNYENAIENYRKDLKEQLTTRMTGDKQDGGLTAQIWEMVSKAPKPDETMDLLASAAKIFRRAGMDNLPPTLDPSKTVMTKSGPMLERKAKNLLDWVKDNPDAVISKEETLGGVTDQMLFDWAQMNKVVYQTADNVWHLIDDSKHSYVVKTLPRGTKTLNPTTMVKLQGDNIGRVTEYGYSTIGDHGIPSLNKHGELMVDGVIWRDMPENFHPIENDPIHSNAQFMRARLIGDSNLGIEDGILSISVGDLPMLERIALKGVSKDTAVFYGGQDVTGSLEALLQDQKLLWRNKMIQEGENIQKISRALNVTEDFAERGTGDGFMLSKLEDHSKPGYVVIEYETSRIPKGLDAQGLASLMHRVDLGKDLNMTVAASLLGPHFKKLFKTEGTLLNMSTVERFSSTFTSHQPDLGGMGMVTMQAGKVAIAAKQELREGTVNVMNSFDAQVKQTPEAVGELNQFINKMRNSTERTFVLNADDIQALGINTTRNAIFMKESLYKKFFDKDANLDEAREALTKALHEKQAVTLNSDVAEAWAMATHGVVQGRMEKWRLISSARGIEKNYDSREFVLPAIDTRKYPHVAFVKEKFQTGMGEPEGIATIIGHTKAEFEAKLNRMRELYGDRFDFHTQSDLKQWAAIEGEYYEMPFIGKTMADDAIRKEGFHEFIARTDAEFIKDFNQWHWRQDGRIIDQAIELHYAQEFAEIRALGADWEKLNKMKYHNTDVKTRATQNPYLRYISTALGISDFDRYNSIWGKITSSTEKKLGQMFEAWDVSRNEALEGRLDWQTANKTAERFGFRPMYGDVVATMVNPAINSRELQGYMAKANGLVSTLTLGLDFLNSLVQAISLPINLMSETSHILRSIKAGDASAGELRNMMNVGIPGATDILLPTPMKLFSKALSNMVNEKNLQWAKYYEDIGAVTLPSQQYLSVVNSSRMTPQAFQSGFGLQGWLGQLETSVRAFGEAGKKYTGYNFSEWATRYITSDIARQMGEAASLSADKMPAYINTFVNRVHGNYIAAQRPHIFQGLVGQAISLFQTYQFNIMQNMVRYGQAGDKTAMMTMLGMQNAIFGFQSNPGFYVLNEAIGKSNKDHIDLTTGMKSIIGDDISDWVLYGLGSNALQTSLYNRGDLTPRYVTVLPTKLEDIPTIAIPTKAILAFVQTAQNVAKGGAIGNSILDGISHFGINRPLAGLAQLAQGQRTTNKGNILAAYNDFNGFTIAAKLAGGEELDRAIAIDAYYRNNAYKQYDREQLQSLGEAVKTRLYRGQQPSQDEVLNFMSQYTRAGGNPTGFNRFMINATKYANESQANIMMRDVNSRSGRAQAIAMGGDEIPDYMNQRLFED